MKLYSNFYSDECKKFLGVFKQRFYYYVECNYAGDLKKYKSTITQITHINDLAELFDVNVDDIKQTIESDFFNFCNRFFSHIVNISKKRKLEV